MGSKCAKDEIQINAHNVIAQTLDAMQQRALSSLFRLLDACKNSWNLWRR